MEKCNCVVQISAVCNKYDQLEEGAPTFNERMEMIRKIAPRVKRVIVRVQPFMHEVFQDVYKNLDTFKEVGAYGFIVEGIKFKSKRKGLVKVGGDFVYPYQTIYNDFVKLKEKAHKIGLKIYAGENRLRKYGDSMTCCGIDGLEGFKGNSFNLAHILNGDLTKPTPAQNIKGKAKCFHALTQTTAKRHHYNKLSFAEAMLEYYDKRKENMHKVFGITK